MQKYIIDTNVFIQAKNFHYGFSFCGAFWDCLIALHHQGRLFSINKVKKELLAGEDELSEWVKNLPDSFWLDDQDENTLKEYPALMNWAYSQSFKEQAKADFADVDSADAWIIAYAKAYDFAVVSQEKSNPDQKKKIFLADVANQFGVAYLSIFEFLTLHTQDTFEPK